MVFPKQRLTDLFSGALQGLIKLTWLLVFAVHTFRTWLYIYIFIRQESSKYKATQIQQNDNGTNRRVHSEKIVKRNVIC